MINQPVTIYSETDFSGNSWTAYNPELTAVQKPLTQPVTAAAYWPCFQQARVALPFSTCFRGEGLLQTVHLKETASAFASPAKMLIIMRCIVYVGTVFSHNRLHAYQQPPSRNKTNPLKTACGCSKNEWSHRQSSCNCQCTGAYTGWSAVLSWGMQQQQQHISSLKLCSQSLKQNKKMYANIPSLQKAKKN